MEWLEVKITFEDNTINRSGLVETVSNILVVAGVETFTVEDYSDMEETLSQGGLFYDYIEQSLLDSKDDMPIIRAYLPTNSQGEEIFKDMTDALNRLSKDDETYSSLTYVVNNVKEEDWENSWKAYFKPFKVGRKLLVKPSWENIDSDDGRKVIEIDPSSSFGSGTHSTTRLCLCAIEKAINGGEKVLDMGCGSGILGIAALLLGAKELTAVDIDENATRIAKENLEKNNFEPSKYKVVWGDVLSNEAFAQSIGDDYDLICANIVAGIIIMLSDWFYKILKTGGHLIASGIITERGAEVKQALEKSGFKVKSVNEEEGWLAYLLEK